MVLPSTIGPLEIIIIFLIILIIFGPHKLVEISRSLGRSIREFRESLEGRNEEREEKAGKDS